MYTKFTGIGEPNLKIFEEFVKLPTNAIKYPGPAGVAESVNCYLEVNENNTYLKGIEGLRTKLDISNHGVYDLLYVTSVGEEQYNYRPSLIVVRNGNLYRYNHMYEETLLMENVGTNVRVAESGGENPCLYIVNGHSKMYILRLKENNAQLITVDLPYKIDVDEPIVASDIAVVSGSVVVIDRDTSFVYYSVPYPVSNETRVAYRINNVGENYKVEYESDEVTPKYVALKADGRYEYNYDTQEVGAFIDNSDNVYSYMFLDDFHNKQYFNAESSSDLVNGLYSLGKTMILFGTNSVEFWSRGDAESYNEWQRESFTDYKEQGLYNRDTVASCNGYVFFVGQGDFAKKHVSVIKNTEIIRISTPWVEQLLNSQEKIGYGFSFYEDGHNFYCLELDSCTICYDLNAKAWHKRVSRRSGSSLLYKWAARFVVRFNDELITGSNHYNKLFKLDEDYFYEDTDGEAIPLFRQRTSPVMVSQYRPFVISQLAVEGANGYANEYVKKDYSKLGDYEVATYNPKILLEVSTDGGSTFGNIVEGNTGRKGDYSFRTIFANLGMYRLAVIRLTYSEPTPFVVNSVQLAVRGTLVQV